MLVAEDIIEETPVLDESEIGKENENEQIEDISNEIKPIAVVINSRNSEAENQDAINQLQRMAQFPIHPYFYQNKGISLTSVYNQILAQVQEDIVVFMHDDVELISACWGRTLYNLFKNNPDFGIIGVAGSKDYDEDGAWWIYKNKVGQVFHRQDVEDKEGNKGYVTFRTNFSDKLPKGHLEEVCIIDGLFIAFDKTKTDVYFDEEINGFNFYDITFCLNNFKAKKTKIGVTTDIALSHKGLGVIRPEWYVNREIVMKKYADILPISNMQLNTPTEGKTDVPAFKEENDPWKKGLIKLVNNNQTNQENGQQKEANGEENNQ